MILLVHVCYISFLDNTVWLKMFPQFRLVGSTLIVGLFNFSDIGILVQMTLFCASKAVQQHQCLLLNRRQLDLASCDGPKCCQTSPHVHWTFNWEMKLPLIESQILSGFIAMNHLEKKKKIASYLELFSPYVSLYSLLPESLIQQYLPSTQGMPPPMRGLDSDRRGGTVYVSNTCAHTQEHMYVHARIIY